MFEKIARHADLVEKMSHSAGVDLGLSLCEGRLSPEGLRGAVYACATCDRVESCQHFLAEEADGPRPAPDYCLNKPLFDLL